MTVAQASRPFLTAEWRDLVMLNYSVEPTLLQTYVPAGTSLDSFEGKTYVSLVGFQFLHTKILGRFAIPFHTNFEEVNLRFYVRRLEGNEIRRGVVFISEIVPRRAIATVARMLYREKYSHAAMGHTIEIIGEGTKIEFQWRVRGKSYQIHARSGGPPAHPQAGTLAEFITEHYWGYSTQPSGGSVEYRVSHTPWRVWEADSTANFEGEASILYGTKLGPCFRRHPDSAFIAEGSAVTVFPGRRLE